jgi:hypothetical protein
MNIMNEGGSNEIKKMRKLYIAEHFNSKYLGRLLSEYLSHFDVQMSK